MILAQISDCHIGIKQNNDNLEKIVKKLKQLHIKIVVVSGDITENGLLSEYLQFQYIMADFEVFALAGNHDNLINMQKVFSQKHLQNFKLSNFNIQLINSKIENKVSGFIDVKNIDTTLENSIIFTHHPIVKMQSSWNDDLSCENMELVQDFIKNNKNKKNIKSFCFGHTHEAKDFKIKEIDIYSCPSTAYSFDDKNKIGFNVYTLDKEIKKTTIWV